MTEVVIDAKLLNSFKRRALHAYPIEYAMALWGKQDADIVEVHALLNVKVETRSSEEIEYWLDPDEPTMLAQGLVLVGSIHTHPDGACAPSDDDIVGSRELGECVVGICAIRKASKRRFVSYGFFDQDGRQLELTVSE